eukprot:gnl/MRDRNA2_/MRDRNA2_33227_c0_seq1.p1 gnl/MRDRNA2_/MRDRNA2_33227_c0~~gnl/MRDRNA2_/MRDRNA2_33227_c0_seq1.p1  ORF type:complete len:353 (+),score=84.43 gnl/MRDRNA2_/MRDRNA2_33227_c0_seq1:157-1215(+)
MYHQQWNVPSSSSSSCIGNVIQQIHDAATFFGRFGLPDDHVDCNLVKRKYRQMALQVHPDKCDHVSAKEAFQMLSEAFDVIGSAAGQKRYLIELSSSKGRRSTTQERKEKEAAAEGRWWNTATWEEFEKRFHHRDAAEAALHVEFTTGLKAKLNRKKVRSQVLAAERSTEHCDRAAGFPESDLWPPESRLEAGALHETVIPLDTDPIPRPQTFEDRPELDHPHSAVPRLVELLTHLRTVHRYCLYCGCVFESFEDLERNCPGFTEDEHDEARNMAMRTPQENTVEAAGQIEEWEEDPLDAFMAGMQDQLQKDIDADKKAKRKRQGGAAPGWSFEQQNQQNKNLWKAAKRARK